MSEAEAALLERPERPIVLLRARPGVELAPGVAPGVDTIGVMLPATPLHLLLSDAVDRPLVMTSGNRSEEPIAIGNLEARRRLAVIADGFLLHDREILSGADDSVIRVVGDAPVFLRRSRGYAPLTAGLPVATPVPLLAVGPHLKNTFTVAAGTHAWLSPHIGDLENLEGLEHFRHTLAAYRRRPRQPPASRPAAGAAGATGDTLAIRRHGRADGADVRGGRRLRVPLRRAGSALHSRDDDLRCHPGGRDGRRAGAHRGSAPGS